MSNSASLRGRFALAIVGVSAAVVVACGVVVYRQISGAATRAATEHLESGSRELGGLFGTSARTVLSALGSVAADTSVISYLRTADGRRADAARLAIRRLAPTAAMGEVELWTRTGQRAVETSSDLPDLQAATKADIMALVSGADSTMIARLRAEESALAYEAVGRVGGTASPLGFVVLRRRVSGSGIDAQLRAVVGADATVFVGNVGDSAWTDLRRLTPRPPISSPTSKVVEYKRPGLGPVLGSMTLIGNTPWALVIEIPRDTVLRDVRHGMLVITLFGLVALILATAIAWRLSGAFTRPLAELATAARGITAGDYDRQLTVRRDDEVGAVAQAFNQMSASLRAGRGELEAKVAEAASSARRLQRVIASSGAVLYELWSTDDVMALTWISENVPAVLGYSVEEALTPGWWSMNVHPEDYAPVTDDDALTIAKDGSRDYRFRHKDGRYRWMRDDQRISPDDDATGGRGAHVVGTWLDITEQRQLEEQLRHAQKMEAIGTLAGGVAHDFNNILTVVTSYAELLSRTETDAERRSDLDEIVAAARRATLLTRQLLTFSRKSLAEPQSINVSYVVARLGGMLRRLLKENIKLVPRLSDEVAPVLGDPNQLEQVLMNLVINAADAMPDGGTLVIETQNIELDDAYARSHGGVTPGRYVMLAVTDTGTGIDSNIIDKIFEPFFTTKPPGHGTGLGLASTYAIVKEVGGHIWAYSEPGQGTTFKIYFPWLQKSESAPVVTAPAAELHMTGTALLVEDDARVRRAVRRMLERIGFDVIEAADGEAGLAMAAAHEGTIDVVVTDLMMPRLGGGGFAKRLAMSRPNVPVVFTSGYTDDAAFRRGLLESEYTFVQKPFTREHLEAAVTRVTRRAKRQALTDV